MKKWFVKGEDGRLTLFDDEDIARRTRRGSQTWGMLIMTTLRDSTETLDSIQRESRTYEVGEHHGESCSCRSCHMKYHGGW